MIEIIILLVIIVGSIVAVIKIDGLQNPYCGTLVVISNLALVASVVLAHKGFFWSSIVPAIVGVGIWFGLKEPKASPSHVLLLTFMGEKTDYVSFGPVLTLPKVVEAIEISLLQEDQNLTFEKDKAIKVTTIDENGEKVSIYMDCKVSFTVKVDTGVQEGDTPMYSMYDPSVSAGQRLKDYDNNGQMKGVTEKLKDIYLAACQEVANNIADPDFLEVQINAVSDLVQKQVEKHFTDLLRAPNARWLGVMFTRVVATFFPPADVIKARNQDAVQQAERASQLQDTKNKQARIHARRQFYLNNGEQPPTVKEIEHQLDIETLINEGKATAVVNEGRGGIINELRTNVGGGN